MKKLKRSSMFPIPIGLFLLIITLHLKDIISSGTASLLALFVVLLSILELSYQIRKTQVVDNEKQYRRIEALMAVYQSFNTAMPPLPDIHGWAAAPDLLKLLLKIVHKHKPKIIVELGSGVSTFIMGYICKQFCQGKIYSLEHHKAYATQTKEQLALHALQNVATVIHAPLKKQTFNNTKIDWYDISVLTEIEKIDLLVVDGPPGNYQALSRYPAVPVLYEKLSKDAVIILDDGNREDEREIAERWIQEYPDLKLKYIPLEKGVFIFYRKP